MKHGLSDLDSLISRIQPVQKKKRFMMPEQLYKNYWIMALFLLMSFVTIFVVMVKFIFWKHQLMPKSLIGWGRHLSISRNISKIVDRMVISICVSFILQNILCR